MRVIVGTLKLFRITKPLSVIFVETPSDLKIPATEESPWMELSGGVRPRKVIIPW